MGRGSRSVNGWSGVSDKSTYSRLQLEQKQCGHPATGYPVPRERELGRVKGAVVFASVENDCRPPLPSAGCRTIVGQAATTRSHQEICQQQLHHGAPYSAC